VAQLGVQVAEALEYAAGQEVLHRDIKPSNLLLDVWGTVWLTDFGLAKATGTPDLTRPSDLLGTLRYLAPERFEGRADVRSDVYALGLTLYELLALQPAFSGKDQAELARQIATAEPPRLDRIEPHLPRDLVTIVHKAMAKDPAHRYSSPRPWPTTCVASSTTGASWRGVPAWRNRPGAGAGATRRGRRWR
jgi:serine/threonine protein kinase